MAWIDSFPSAFSGAAASERTEQAWRAPVGAASPLWALFGAAAGAGVVYWWMTSWARLVNVEALTIAAPTPPKPQPRQIEIAAEPAPAAAEAAIEAPTSAVEEIVEAVIEDPSAGTAAPDDLTRLTGIGPKLSAALAERGVTRFAQIAAWTAEDLAAVDAALSLKGRAVREAWVAQARRLAE